MLRTEVRTCRKCKKTYIWKGGGIVMTPRDIDFGLCPKCRRKKAFGCIFKKEDENKK